MEVQNTGTVVPITAVLCNFMGVLKNASFLTKKAAVYFCKG
jgi:hypothetical protein